MPEVIVTPWQQDGEPNESILRAMLEKEGLIPSTWSRESGERFPVQTSSTTRIVYCIEGGIWFMITDDKDRVIELEPGDRIEIPAGVRHGAMAGMDGVTCLEGTPTITSS
jgi:quercetin dioxygenase-like cupin family protein